MGPSKPWLATVLPVLNEENHIEACLNSLLHQSLPADEHMILVMDGGSTDATREIIQSVMSNLDGDKHPTLLYHENPGRFVPHARNLALQHLPRRRPRRARLARGAAARALHAPLPRARQAERGAAVPLAARPALAAAARRAAHRPGHRRPAARPRQPPRAVARRVVPIPAVMPAAARPRTSGESTAVEGAASNQRVRAGSHTPTLARLSRTTISSLC